MVDGSPNVSMDSVPRTTKNGKKYAANYVIYYNLCSVKHQEYKKRQKS